MTVQVSLQHAFDAFALDVAFEVPAGVTALFGPSGAGKSSVIKAVAGLMRPDRGVIRAGDQVLLDTDKGINLPPHRRRIGCVFQDDRLFPHLTVRQNLSYGRWLSPDKGGVSFDQVVAILGIAPLLARRPQTVS